MNTSLRLLTVLAVAFSLSRPTTVFASPDNGDEAALNAAVRQSCARQVVMLGESATHGDGHTEAFKVALVERLVNECGFDSVFFEASHYEFLQISRHLRAGKAVSADQVSDAIGGLWKFAREFQPLVPFLLEKAVNGKISLGGIDDQLGQLGQNYSNVELAANLTMVLPKPEGRECNDALHRRIYSDGYTKADGAKIVECLSAIRRYYEGNKSADRMANAEWLQMIDAIQRWTDRDSLSATDQIVARDRSMFANFQWLRRQQPRRHKVILWAATVHIAKEGDPTWADHIGTNFGSFVHREYGAQAFSLGFSALEGTYRQGRKVLDQPVAPTDSLEAQALRGKDAEAVFLGPAQLSSLGTVSGAIFRHSYQQLPWSKYLDGVVVFRKEHAPIDDRKN